MAKVDNMAKVEMVAGRTQSEEESEEEDSVLVQLAKAKAKKLKKAPHPPYPPPQWSCTSSYTSVSCMSVSFHIQVSRIRGGCQSQETREGKLHYLSPPLVLHLLVYECLVYDTRIAYPTSHIDGGCHGLF